MTTEPTTPLASLPIPVGVRLIALGRLDAALAARERLTGARDEEALHDFRVALRRLRSGLRVYRPWFDDTVGREDRHRLRDLAQATGEARDIEVQLAWLDQATLEPPAADGAHFLRAELERRRKEADRAALRSAHRFPAEAEGLRERFGRYTAVVDPDHLYVEATGVVTARLASALLAELESQFEALRQDGSPRSGHEARIAGKRLRYLIEPFRETVDEAEPALVPLRDLQDALGELHDHDVLVDRTAGLAEEPDTLGRALERSGLEALVSHLRGLRADVLERIRSTHLADEAVELADRVRAFVDAIRGDFADDLEIERKFLLNGLPRRRRDRRVVRIDQGWLPGERILERLRRVRGPDGTRYLRTIKLGSGLVRREVEEELDEATFRSLWPLTRGRRISKRRYTFRDGQREWIVDRFLHRDLILAEIELDSPDDDVEPPAWLRRYIEREVTGLADYLNVNLAGAAGGPGRA